MTGKSSGGTYRIEFFSQEVQEQVKALPEKIRMRMYSLFERMEQFGSNLGPPHTEQVPGYPRLFEVRAKPKEGIGRAYYCTVVNRKIWVLHVIVKKTQKAPQQDLELAYRRLKEIKNEQN